MESGRNIIIIVIKTTEQFPGNWHLLSISHTSHFASHNRPERWGSDFHLPVRKLPLKPRLGRGDPGGGTVRQAGDCENPGRGAAGAEISLRGQSGKSWKMGQG